MKSRVISSLLALIAASPAIQAQSSGGSRPLEGRPDLAELLGRWNDAHRPNWRVQADSQTGWLEMLYGGDAPAAYTPQQDEQFVELARAMLAETAAMHGLDAGTLVFESTLFLPLGMIGSGDKMTVKFRQEVGGVRVVGGFVNVLFSSRGALLSIQSTAQPHIAGFDTEPIVSSGLAALRALSAFEKETGLSATQQSAPELVIDQVLVGGRRLPRLAWRTDVQWHDDASVATGYTYSIDAKDGSVLRREESVHTFDITGTVKSMASPGTLPDIASNPETSQNMQYLSVTSPNGNATTDANGNFTIAGVNSATAVTVNYVGTFNGVQNAAGSAYTLTQTIQPNTPTTITMNPSSSATVTSQANAFNVVNKMRDFIRSINPADIHGDFVHTASVNEGSTCNAFWDGGAIHFFLSGGGCVNTAYSSVISHEDGHWLNSRYFTGNGSDGMGEGNADVWAMYAWDDPVVGKNFSGSSAIRTGLNNRQFCGDLFPACYGEVHSDGEPWMGAAWKVRSRLNTSLGNAMGDLVANNIFLGWMNGYNQGTIRSIIETQWLTLDDDDGNINTSTPHFADIDGGFRQQGFPGVVIIPPCPTQVEYCVTSPNSVGSGALIHSNGSTRVSNNDFSLIVVGARPNTTGLFFYGQNQTQVAFGNGVLCVGSPFFRLPARQANIFGDFNFQLDLGLLPAGGQISAGQQWNFQCYYRDIAGGGAGFNTSDGLNTTWCP